MTPADILCPACRQPLTEDPEALGSLTACPACRKPLRISVLAGFGRPAPTGSAPRPALGDSDARCFFHAESRAEVPCDACGRYLCALCDVPVAGRHLCPECVAHAPAVVGPGGEADRIRWDLVAGWLLGLSFLFCWPALLATGPTAVFLAFWARRRPGSRIARSGIRLTLCGVAGAVLFFAAAGMTYFITAGMGGGGLP